MKDFMMIFMGPDYGEIGLSPDQIQQRMGKWFGWSEKMTKEGRDPKGNALLAPGRTISGTEKVVTDGPFLEGKELIGGYYVIKAKDFDDVQQVAMDFPDYDLGGTVEIREVMVFE